MACGGDDWSDRPERVTRRGKERIPRLDARSSAPLEAAWHAVGSIPRAPFGTTKRTRFRRRERKLVVRHRTEY